LIGLASATSNLSSGFIFAAAGYTMVCVVGGVIALLPLGLTAWWLFKGARPADAVGVVD
jgi:hypothetical protein